MHQACTAAACDHLAALIGCGVLELNDPLRWTRFAGAFGNDPGMSFQGIAMEYRLRKLDIGHAEIADGGSKRGVVHAHADHDPERVEAVEEPLAELGCFGEMSIKVQRLRVHCEQA